MKWQQTNHVDAGRFLPELGDELGAVDEHLEEEIDGRDDRNLHASVDEHDDKTCAEEDVGTSANNPVTRISPD